MDRRSLVSCLAGSALMYGAYSSLASGQDAPLRDYRELDRRSIAAREVAIQVGAISWPLFNDPSNPLKKEEGRGFVTQAIRANPANPYLTADRGFMNLYDGKPCEARIDFSNAYQQMIRMSQGRLDDWKGKFPREIETGMRMAEFDIRVKEIKCR